ncbi:MAG TPA: hypothetical protein VFB58_13300 [Chloroflexota bacterium]|nr:hypothetical protein [Chloroflexota bacterium]
MTLSVGRLHITVALAPPELPLSNAERRLRGRRLREELERERMRWITGNRRWL